MKNKSIEELEKLIAENNAEAMYEMGIYLSKNENSTDEDYNKAVKYFKKAEELGYIKGKYGLARSYYYGIGVEQDYEKAYTMFYELMTQYNDPDAKYYIGQMYYYGELVKKDYKKAYEIFCELYEENKNDEYVKRHLGEMYYLGRGTDINYKKAREIAEDVLKNCEDTYLSYDLGLIYFYGQDVKKDYKKAEKYLKNSITEDDCAPEYYLGCIYKEGGYGIDKDCKKSKEYFGKVEYDLCRALIYHSLAVSAEVKGYYESIFNYYSTILKDLGCQRTEITEIMQKLPNEHPSNVYYRKLRYLKDEQYENVKNKVTSKINKYFIQNPVISIMTVCSDDDVDILARNIIESYDYGSVKDYLDDKLKNNDEEILYFVGRIYYYGNNVTKNEKYGKELLKKSAKLGNKFAIKELELIKK